MTYIDSLSVAHKSTQRTPFVSGTFYIVHPGHLRMLRFTPEQAA